MADIKSAYREHETEMERMRARYGADAEGPSDKTSPVPEALPARIARLAKEIAEAGERLAGARVGYEKAARARAECEARFTQLSEQLMQAMHEHREGMPEGVLGVRVVGDDRDTPLRGRRTPRRERRAPNGRRTPLHGAGVRLGGRVARGQVPRRRRRLAGAPGERRRRAGVT